ncbi:hypothetical protein ScPMuIL_016678 [Solemya velum]
MEQAWEIWVGVVIQTLLWPCVQTQTRTEFVQALLGDYDSRIPPNFEKKTPTFVNVHLYINSIDSINEQTMDFTIDALVHQEWYDTRLKFYNLIQAEYLELDSRLMREIWVPDLYFANEKRASFHDVTVPNRMIHLYDDGKIMYRSRVSVTASCPMRLQKYPMDFQICSLYIQSFAYSTQRLQFQWMEDKPIEMSPDLELPQFESEKVTVDNCTGKYGSGNFTCLRVDFHLRRNIGYYMIQIYIPSMFIVMLSWVSFWLNTDAVPARISLGILTVLTMTTQKSVAVSSLPRVSYVKAIDVWMAACLCFVFSSLLEFALVNVMDRRQIKRQMSVRVPEDGNASKREPKIAKSTWITDPHGKQKAKRVDSMSRILFPLTFLWKPHIIIVRGIPHYHLGEDLYHRVKNPPLPSRRRTFLSCEESRITNSERNSIIVGKNPALPSRRETLSSWERIPHYHLGGKLYHRGKESRITISEKNSIVVCRIPHYHCGEELILSPLDTTLCGNTMK